MAIVSLVSNFASTIARDNIQRTNEAMTDSTARLSSGIRVLSAQDDPAAKVIGNGLSSDIAALESAQKNVAQGISALQIADGSIFQINQVLERLETLAVTSASDQISDTERAILDVEYQTMLTEINRIAASTKFNGVNLLGGANEFQINGVLGANIDSTAGFAAFEFNGDVMSDLDDFTIQYYSATNLMVMENVNTGISQSLLVQQPNVGFTNTYNFNELGVEITLSNGFDPLTDIGVPAPGATETFEVTQTATSTAATLTFQVGIALDPGDSITLTVPPADVAALGLATSRIDAKNLAIQAADLIRDAVGALTTSIADIGASLNRLERASTNISVTLENSISARSSLLDTNVAEEYTQLVSKQVLLEAGVSVLAQANQTPGRLLDILRNS